MTIAIQTLVAHLEQLRTHVAELGARVDALQAEDAAPQALLASIPGFGRETSRTWCIRAWCAELPPMPDFATQAREQSRARPPGRKVKSGADELVAAVGLDARIKQSGRRAGRARMSKRGNRYVRRAVTLAARSAALSDPQCRAIYDAQRARGKHHTVALSHVAHQLLHIAYSVLLHERPYTLPDRFTPQPQLVTAGA